MDLPGSYPGILQEEMGTPQDRARISRFPARPTIFIHLAPIANHQLNLTKNSVGRPMTNRPSNLISHTQDEEAKLTQGMHSHEDNPIWWRAHAVPEVQPLEANRTADIVIVGGGLAGLAIAY